MRITCGTDIVEIDRIKESINHMGNKFLDRIYTKKEIEYCESKKQMKYQHYAARFAAKEAIFKAMSCYLEDKWTISWTNVEILNDEDGRPTVKIGKEIDTKRIDTIDVSLSHCKEYATAMVVVVTRY